MKTTGYVTHPDCSRHDAGWAHPEHQGRLPAIARAVYRDMLALFEPLLEVEAVPATEADLLLAHSQPYVDRVRHRAAEAGSAGRVLPFEGETNVSAASWDAGLAAVGSALTGVDLVLDGRVRNAFCAIRPPGHGVGYETSTRYGLFNSVAVAARHLVRRRGLERVLIVECGSAFGAGTSALFARDPKIRFVSISSEVTGDRFDAPPRSRLLPAGSAGETMQAELMDALMEATASSPPDFVLLSLGFDALLADPAGSLALRAEDFFALTETVRSVADLHCAGRLVSVLEEGYHPSELGAAVVQHLHALAGLPPA